MKKRGKKSAPTTVEADVEGEKGSKAKTGRGTTTGLLALVAVIIPDYSRIINPINSRHQPAGLHHS